MKGLTQKPFFHIGRVILLIDLLFVLLVGLFHFWNTQKTLDELKAHLIQADMAQISLLAKDFQPQVNAGEWLSLQQSLQLLNTLSADQQIRIVSPLGATLISGDSAANKAAYIQIPTNALKPPYSPQSQWLPDANTLQLLYPFTTNNQKLTAFLVSVHRLHAPLEAQTNSQNAAFLQFVVLNILFIAILLILIQTLFYQPARRAIRLAHAVTHGNYKMRMEDSAIYEVQEINAAFNLLANRIGNQRQSLEALNQKVARIENEQQPENQALQQRIAQLEGLNFTIATTSNVLEIPALIRATLDQALEILNLSKGAILLGEYSALQGFSDTEKETFRALCDLDQWKTGLNRKVTVSDWVKSPPPLAGMAAEMKAMQIRASIFIPLYLNSKAQGLLTLSSVMPRIWLPEETALLEVIAHQIIFAVERVQHVQDIQSQNQLMKTLVEQSELLNRPYAQEEIIEAIGQGALALTHAEQIFILNRAQENSPLTCPWCYQVSAEFMDTLLRMPAEQVSVFLTTSPLLLETISSTEPSYEILNVLHQHGIASAFVWPVIYEGQADVFVCCFYTHPVQLKTNEQEVIEAFLRQAAATLENTRLFQAESSQRQLAEALREVATRLASTLNLDEVLDGILDQLSRVIPHDASDIMLLEGDTIRILRSRGYNQTDQSGIQTFTGRASQMGNLRWMIENKQAYVISDVTQREDWLDVGFSHWIKSYAGAPLIHRGVVLGFINVSSHQTAFFHAEVAPILATFASQAAIFIENARLYQNTQQRMAETDALFRAMLPLFNPSEDMNVQARHITEAVVQEFASAHCSVMLIDEDRANLVMMAQSGYLQPGKPVLPLNGSGLTVAAVHDRKIIYAPDILKEPSFVRGAPETRSELVIPLRGRDNILGVLNLESPQPDGFDEHAQQLLASYAERASLSLENAHLFETVRQHAEQMIELNSITNIALQNMDSDNMLVRIVRQVAEMIHADGCYITTWDESSQKVTPIAGFGPDQNIYPTIVLAPGETTVTEAALRLNRTVTVEDIRNTPYISHRLAPALPAHSLMAMPLISDKKKLGALIVGFTEHHFFTSEEMALGEQVAGLIVLALTRLRSLELSKRRAHEAETLREASLALTASLELQPVFESTLNHLEQVLPFDGASIFLNKGNSLVIQAARNVPNLETLRTQEFSYENGLFHEIQNTRKPVILLDAQSDPRFERWGKNDRVRSWMGVPLISGNTLLGILTLDRLKNNPFTAEEVTLTQTFANHAALAIQNAQLHSAVQHLAITDPLTGIYNRRGFFDLAQKLLAFNQRSPRPISALMLDIDFFKRVNDRYGHDVGDEVICGITAVCQQMMRSADVICRYGGEEFTILLPDSDLIGAQIAAQRLHTAIVSTPMQTSAGPVSVTVSVGAAMMDKDCKTLEALLKCADMALYTAKQEGRNRVCLWHAQSDLMN